MSTRGKDLEKTADKANMRSRQKRESLILKVPTPMLITSGGLIPQQSTVDFVGILKGGHFLAFDAKETKIKTSFPLKNIHQHQLDYLNAVNYLGGIAFFMIHFKSVCEEVFICQLSFLNNRWDSYLGSGSKSIKYEDFEENCVKCPPSDYLQVLTDEDNKVIKWLKN